MSRASEFLIMQYNLRRAKNRRYSQRAFAKLLEINSGRLSQYFVGDRPITNAAAQKMARQLELDSEQTSYFLYLVGLDKKSKDPYKLRILQDDELAMIVEWYHFAVLSLISTSDFQFDYNWIGNRLRISPAFAEASVQRLERLNFIKIKNNKIEVTKGAVSTMGDIPNEFLRLSHKDMFRHMADTLSAEGVERRDLSSITLAIDDRKLPEAKKLIKNFRRKIADFLSKGSRNQVYALNIQLFPLSHEEP